MPNQIIEKFILITNGNKYLMSRYDLATNEAIDIGKGIYTNFHFHWSLMEQEKEYYLTVTDRVGRTEPWRSCWMRLGDKYYSVRIPKRDEGTIIEFTEEDEMTKDYKNKWVKKNTIE